MNDTPRAPGEAEAIPVVPEDTLIRLAKDVDEVLCLHAPPSFAAVGQFYRRFESVNDE